MTITAKWYQPPLRFRETRIKGNLILLGRAPELQTFTPSPTYAALLTRYTLSLSLARSSALSAVEAKLDAHLESVSKVPHMLEVWGKQPLGRKEVIRKIGELMVLREAVNFRGGGLEDTPEVSRDLPSRTGRVTHTVTADLLVGTPA